MGGNGDIVREHAQTKVRVRRESPAAIAFFPQPADAGACGRRVDPSSAKIDKIISAKLNYLPRDCCHAGLCDTPCGLIPD